MEDNYKMLTYGKKFERITEQKRREYEKVVNFYERNREGRFQNKNDLKKILDEINIELNEKQTTNNLNRNKLYSLGNRLLNLI